MVYWQFTFFKNEWYFTDRKNNGMGNIIREMDAGYHVDGYGSLNDDQKAAYEAFKNLKNKGIKNSIEHEKELKTNADARIVVGDPIDSTLTFIINS